QICRSLFPIVFRAFDRLCERFDATGDHRLYPFRRRAERGRAFRGVERGDAPARSCAYVNDSPTGADGLDCEVDEPGDIGNRGGYSTGNERILAIDNLQNTFSWEEIDV